MTARAHLPLRLVMPWPARELSPNARVHWSKKHKSAKLYRAECGWQARAQKAPAVNGKASSITLSVLFFRPTKRHHDIDNCVASIKSCLDGLADALGVNDKIFRFASAPAIADEVGGYVQITIEEIEQ